MSCKLLPRLVSTMVQVNTFFFHERVLSLVSFRRESQLASDFSLKGRGSHFVLVDCTYLLHDTVTGLAASSSNAAILIVRN